MLHSFKVKNSADFELEPLEPRIMLSGDTGVIAANVPQVAVSCNDSETLTSFNQSTDQLFGFYDPITEFGPNFGAEEEVSEDEDTSEVVFESKLLECEESSPAAISLSKSNSPHPVQLGGGDNDSVGSDKDAIVISSDGLVASGLQDFSIITGDGDDRVDINSAGVSLPVSGGTFSVLGTDVISSLNFENSINELKLAADSLGSKMSREL